jgi:hypothetical protein
MLLLTFVLRINQKFLSPLSDLIVPQALLPMLYSKLGQQLTQG